MTNFSSAPVVINICHWKPVDIIIPFHGQYEKVTRCVSSIISTTPNQEYKIILVDDGSPNEKFLENLTLHNSKTKAIRIESQVGFGSAVNIGLEHSENPFVAIVHSDVYMTSTSWLLNLQRGLVRLKDKGVKLVSARTTNVGTSASYDENLTKLTDTDVIVKSPLPLFCAFFNKELINKIGPLKPYPYAWYEDEELFWRMRSKNYHQAIVNSYVEHEGGCTIRELIKKPKILKIMENNIELCKNDIKDLIH